MKNSILEKGSTKVIMTTDDIFLNSDCLFIEFNDVLRSPWFALLCMLQKNEMLNTIFDMSEIKDMNIDELYEWYVNRDFKSVFKNFPITEEGFESIFKSNTEIIESWIDEFEKQEFMSFNSAIEVETDLNFMRALKMIFGTKMIKRIIVYSEYYNKAIEEFLLENFGTKVEYVSGALGEVLCTKKITSNSTFVFSDIENILILEKCDLLNFSSICIADRYGYNYDKDKVRIDTDELAKKYVFKLDFFDNLNSYE